MTKQLAPLDAANMAKAVYAVNGGDPRSFQRLLSNDLFSQSKRSTHSLTAKVGGMLALSTRDGFGLCAMGGRGYENDAFIIFRGTTSANGGADWLTNGHIGLNRSSAGHPVHVGFNRTFKSMKSQMQTFFSQNRVTGTVHCIGHSLGGAVASLAAEWIKHNIGKSVKLYTFGAPRVGTYFFAKGITYTLKEESMHRVYHKTDPVPMVALFPFMQAPYNSVAHHMESTDLVISAAAHDMGKYVDSVRAKSWTNLNNVVEEPYALDYGIEQWLRSKSKLNVNSPTFLRWAESALIYVLKKLGLSIAAALQGVGMTGSTLMDKIAYILHRGLDLAAEVSMWVIHFMRRIMQALGMKTADSKEQLTKEVMRAALQRLMRNAYEAAASAVRLL